MSAPLLDDESRPYADGIERPYVPRGIAWPFRRSGNADVAVAEGAELVKQNLQRLVTILGSTEPGSDPGEVRWRRNLGSLVPLLRHRDDTPTTRKLAEVYVRQAARDWEPRARINEVRVEGRDVVDPGGAKRRLLVISISYYATIGGRVLVRNTDPFSVEVLP